MPLLARIPLGAAGVGLWAWGLLRFVGGDQLWGGGLVLFGGALIALALSHGLDHFLRGLADWLHFR